LAFFEQCKPVSKKYLLFQFEPTGVAGVLLLFTIVKIVRMLKISTKNLLQGSPMVVISSIEEFVLSLS